MSRLLEYDMNMSCTELGQQDTQCMYNVKLRHVRVNTVAVGNQ
jgi:hypothetical protein